MSENENPRDMLLPWINQKLNDYGDWELWDRSEHIVAVLSFNLDPDDVYVEKHIMDFITDACNDTQQIKEARKQAFLEAAEMVHSLFAGTTGVGYRMMYTYYIDIPTLLRERADEE